MLVVTPFHPGDVEQAFLQATWIYELGRVKGHDLLLIADTRCPATQMGAIRDEYAKSYDSVEVLMFVDHYRKWPESPNQVFGLAARHIMRTKQQPWLMLEPDAIPLRTGWLDALWAEYRAAGKPFLGDLVHLDLPGFTDHMSGNAIYPADMFTHAGLALIADVAWDVAAASQILPQMYRSKLIHHIWNHEPFASWEQVETDIFAAKPDAAIFHADKTGSLYPFLRAKRKQGDARCTNASVEIIQPTPLPVAPISNAVPKFNPDSTATCDLFLKTYPKDYAWAKYCIRSIDKFATGFRQLVIVAPDNDCPTPENIPFTVHVVPEHENGYNWQQVVKLHADKYTNAENVLFCDSDTIFTVPITPETFFRDGKIIWLMTPFENARDDQKRTWIPVMSRWMNKTPEFEFMRRHPFMFPRWLFAEVGGFCERTHGQSIEEYALGQGKGLSFSEFNLSGFLAYERFRDKFAWVNTEVDPVPPLVTLQKRSYDGLDADTEAEFEAILTPASEFVSPEPNGTADAPPAPSEDQIWVKVDANGNHFGTFEFDGKEWVPAKWPRDTSNYQVFFSVTDAPRFEIIDGQYHRVNPAYKNQTPWADKESSLAEIGRLSARLKEFCTGAGRTRQVRDVLRENGVIK